ncbi:hypothetical protein [Paraburkholderia dipogonis]|uniref:hypothetical protein n=1 Tax=Paraburkholderia dipogonis TaxID=1211383 RepID=UPI0038B6D5A2
MKKALSIKRIEMTLKLRSPFHPLLVAALALAIAGIAVVAGAFIFIYSGIYDVSAVSGHNPVVAWALHKTYEQSLHRHARGIEVPADLMNRVNVEAGARIY